MHHSKLSFGINSVDVTSKDCSISQQSIANWKKGEFVL